MNASRPTAHLPQLDALRGIACLLVLLAHLNSVPWLRAMPESAGVAGVGIFFVLSGFLITRILLADLTAGRGLAEFYNRRVARIFPIYFLVLAILAVVWPGEELLWAATFSFNFRFLADARDYFQASAGEASMPPIGHFWSLCVEEHFYWVWPALVVFLPRSVLRLVPLGIIVATPAVTYLLADYFSAAGLSQAEVQGLLSRLTFTQLAGISIGSLAALYESWLSGNQAVAGRFAVRRASAIGAVLVLAGGMWMAASPLMPAELSQAAASTSLHVLCGGVFLAAVYSRALMKLTPLNIVGKYSYGLYLYHLPIYTGFGLAHAGREASVLSGLMALSATAACAVLSYHLLEWPLIALARRQPEKKTVFSSLAGPAGACLSAGVLAAFVASLAASWQSLSSTGSTPAGAALDGQIAAATEFGKTDLCDKSSIHTLVVGSSHGELGFAAPECPEMTYNLSFESQDLWYDCQLVAAIAPQLPNLRRVVFCVSAFSFRYAISDSDSERWRESLYFHACGIRARQEDGDERRYSPLALASSRKTLALLRSKFQLAAEPLQGWRAKTRESFPDESGPLAAQRHQAHSARRIYENQALLITAIQACRERGVECLLVSLPTHASYRDHLTPELVEETRSLVQEISARTGAAYFDYSADKRFDAADFFDGDHLNEAGARKFVRTLTADEHLRVASQPQARPIY